MNEFEKLAGELGRLDKPATPGPWECDAGGAHQQDNAQAVMLGGPNHAPQRLFDTLNSDVAEISYDADEDGTYYFDAQGIDNFRLIESYRNNHDTILRALRIAACDIEKTLTELANPFEHNWCSTAHNREAVIRNVQVVARSALDALKKAREG